MAYNIIRLTFNASLLSNRLKISDSGMNIMMMTMTVVRTRTLSFKSLLNTEAKSMVFGGTKKPAPKLPNRLLLKTGLDGVEIGSI